MSWGETIAVVALGGIAGCIGFTALSVIATVLSMAR